MKKFKITGLLITVVSLLTGVALPVNAAFPGTNGKVAYSGFVVENGNPTAVPFDTVNIDGSGKVTLIDDIMTTSLAPVGGRFSADGKKIVYSRTNVNNSESNIYTMNADGTNEQNLTNIDTSAFPNRSGYGANFGAFSPDGSKIIYAEGWDEDLGSGNESFCHLFTMNSDGSNKQQLTSDSTLCDIYPVYSPDGSKIAFLRSDKLANTTSIYTVDANGTNITLVKQLAAETIHIGDFSFAPLGTAGSSIDWSPDGSKIVYATYELDGDNIINSTIATTDLQGNATTIASFSEEQFDTINETGRFSNEAFLNPQFTPEGQIIFRRIAISVDRSPNEDDNTQWESTNEQGIARIQLMNTDGSNVRTVLTSDTLLGNDASFVLYTYNFPSVQPLGLSSANIDSNVTALASTGLNTQTLIVLSIIILFTALGLGVVRKYQG